MNNMKKNFLPPTAEQRAKALGLTEKMDANIRRALTVGIDDSFPPIPMPNEGDWLSEHEESGQSVKEFERAPKTRPHSTYRTIYIQPIGEYGGPRSPSLDVICEFAHLFFPGCQTEILSSINFDSKMKKRINRYTNQPQYLTTTLFAHLKTMQRKRRRNRQELFCIGVTMVDIYPQPDWNFVYGEASIDDGIGIYSFARLDPLFPYSTPEMSQKPCSEPERLLILKRAVTTFLHEVIHLFGLEHCVYYLCLMNGANCGEEMDAQPLYLCPICLRKMYLVFEKQQFNIIDMYKGLFELCKKVGLQDEVIWYENRLRILEIET